MIAHVDNITFDQLMATALFTLAASVTISCFLDRLWDSGDDE